MKKLYIHYNGDWIDRSQADGRFDTTDQIFTIAAGSPADLTAKVTALIAAGAAFDRVLFQTHGGAGYITFGDGPGNYIDATNVSTVLPGVDALFPSYTRVYFDGCNVADGGAGWAFLKTVGAALCKRGGGTAFGWTSLGLGLPGWLPFVGGHTWHPWGDTRWVMFGPGGAITGTDSTTQQALRARKELREQSGCVGFKC